ncbi:unnamed protein product [Phyllotreta striolata]|uniref:Aminopeptidase n=1 Tax=Phyllotreta striolata TaxID=444603 RepID=A0A9N9TRG2_PHYSR|nr:unnamed protein product [Phyllotreta striolata]
MKVLLHVVFLTAHVYYLVNCEAGTYRLSPTEAVPTQYSITIRPDFENSVFSGEVSIQVTTKGELQCIVLHSSNLTIEEVKINGKNATYELQLFDKIGVSFATNETIQAGDQLVHIKYKGVIGRELGFIRASFENDDEIVKIYVTELEPDYARTVFPCFDEPIFKALFNLRLISPNETYKAISNMQEANKIKTAEGTVVYVFEQSPKMSTYLLSFAFTNPSYTYYENFMDIEGNQIPIRIHTVNASAEKNQFAFKCAETALQFYSTYTDEKYPLTKLDMVEYKRNLTAATENWGLITFREGLLTPSLRIYNKYQVKLVMFHELGHFWFGNLVTNKWWSDLWLQEGFATYMSYKLLAIDSKGKKDVVNEMRTFGFNDYFELDLTSNKPAIVSYLPTQSSIDDVFNELVYYKSAGMLYMLEDFIGEDTFQQIVQKFMKKYRFSTASTNDFILTAEEVVKSEPLRAFLKSYLYQKKFPVINVDVLDNGTYVLNQEPALTLSNTEKSEGLGQKWVIPVSYITDSGNISRFWFDEEENPAIREFPEAKWIVLNPTGMAVYRVAYSKKLWDQIIENFEEIPVASTESIILDLYYSFRINKVGCDTVINLMNRVKRDCRNKWVYFHTVIEHIKEGLICMDHKQEASLFWNFFVKRLEETEYGRHPLNIDAECDNEYILTGIEYKQHFEKCAAWITENLTEKESNAIPA